MSLKQLTNLEIEQVSGAGALGGLVQTGANIFAGGLNVQAPIWKPLSLIPGVGTVHQVIDTGFLAISEGVYKAGALLGGDKDQIKFHYDKEKNDGTYNPCGVIQYA